MRPPAYFEAVRSEAAGRWDQLERDPILAGPWHQLFRQVQSPRHVLSELLQNADDVGATEASVAIRGSEFVFSHNGADFEKSHFESLCRFGFSNKRTLHTIGFRGIGFKSTFSLGDEVRIGTPTLSVVFRRNRFTEPAWLEDGPSTQGRTEIRVALRDENRRLEIEKNLKEWMASPASLLFFNRIRCLRINGQALHWLPRGAGPVRNSEWLALSTSTEKQFLLIRSEAEGLPAEAVEEVLEERGTSLDELGALPPCRVEIVLGLEGRLFVILPTGVRTTLPFACNAPFIQDPARVQIKPPETSPTNRWLLDRAGRLAAIALQEWLRRPAMPATTRAGAYDLLPDHDSGSTNSLDGTCASLVIRGIQSETATKDVLLTTEGSLVPASGAIAPPSALLDVWSAPQISAAFDERNRPVLCGDVSLANRAKLARWRWPVEIDRDRVLRVLESHHLPKPASWGQLLVLWDFVQEEVTKYWFPRTGVRIVPVEGKGVLYAASEVVRLAEKKLLESKDDWEFLAEFMLVMAQRWGPFLAEQRRHAAESSDASLQKVVEAGTKVLTKLGLADATGVDEIIERIAGPFFERKDPPPADCVRLAHIAATLGAALPPSFRCLTQDGQLTKVSDGVVADVSGDLDQFVTGKWYTDHALHDEYAKGSSSCPKQHWRDWLVSGKTGLLTFVPIEPSRKTLYVSRDKLKVDLRSRGVTRDLYFKYAPNSFILEDWDFALEHWQHWTAQATKDPGYWVRLVRRIVGEPSRGWAGALSARCHQSATTGSRSEVTSEPILPSWVLRLRGLPCLPDTWGGCRQPAELLRRTGETEALLGVEPFVDAALDTEANRPLLIALGVRDTPTGPNGVLDRLRALSKASNPPVEEVAKWYRRLDKLTNDGGTQDLIAVKQAFATEPIILLDGGGWSTAAGAFLHPDEDVPGAGTVHASARELALWTRVGVNERPTADRAIAWLKTLVLGNVLAADEVRRVRALLGRYPERIWLECEAWLNLDGQWVATSSLAYSLSMQTLVPWKHLFPSVKQQTADFQKLEVDALARTPFAALPPLARSIEERFDQSQGATGAPATKAWITAFGSTLKRVLLPTTQETDRVRDLARRLEATKWLPVRELQAVPYINGAPAGQPRPCEALWKGTLLYVRNRSYARLANHVAAELGSVFEDQSIADALRLCYERPPEFITEILEEAFELAAESEVSAEKSEGQASRPGGLSTLDQEEVAPEGPSVQESPVGVVEGAAPERDAAPVDDGARDGGEGESRRSPRKPTRPTLMESFAHLHGFVPESPERFYHTDGRSLQHQAGPFPWQMYSPEGRVIQSYCVTEHCLEREPIKVDVEVWASCQQSPEHVSILLRDPQGAPVAIKGGALIAMEKAGRLRLYPAVYRLVREPEA